MHLHAVKLKPFLPTVSPSNFMKGQSHRVAQFTVYLSQIFSYPENKRAFAKATSNRPIVFGKQPLLLHALVPAWEDNYNTV